MCADCVGDGICVVTQMAVDSLCINMPIGDIGCVAGEVAASGDVASNRNYIGPQLSRGSEPDSQTERSGVLTAVNTVTVAPRDDAPGDRGALETAGTSADRLGPSPSTASGLVSMVPTAADSGSEAPTKLDGKANMININSPPTVNKSVNVNNNVNNNVGSESTDSEPEYRVPGDEEARTMAKTVVVSFDMPVNRGQFVPVLQARDCIRKVVAIGTVGNNKTWHITFTKARKAEAFVRAGQVVIEGRVGKVSILRPPAFKVRIFWLPMYVTNAALGHWLMANYGKYGLEIENINMEKSGIPELGHAFTIKRHVMSKGPEGIKSLLPAIVWASIGTGRHRIMFGVQGKAVKCLRCGKLGHIRRDCPTCAECRQPGHVKADCEWTMEQGETFANKLRFSLEKREEDKQAALSALHSQWDKEKG